MKKPILVVLALIIAGFLVVNGFRGGSGAVAGEWHKSISWQDPAITRAADPKVQNLLNDKFIALEINPETSGTTNFLGEKLSYADAATRLGVRGYPASFFFAPDGSFLGGQAGYIDAGTFGDIAEYIGGGYYQKYSYNEFKSLPADKRK
jgi:hypothetical protein